MEFEKKQEKIPVEEPIKEPVKEPKEPQKIPVKEPEKPLIESEDKVKLLQMSKISLGLDDYDDIFSDFDPRPFSQRIFSDDFIAEAKKAAKGKASGTIELNLIMPKEKRNSNAETVIKKRVREHFKKDKKTTIKAYRKIRWFGARFVMIGIILMLIGTYVLFDLKESFFSHFLVILLEPAGWFLFWEGLNQIVFKSKEILPDVEFYKKMSRVEIKFSEY